MLPPLVILYLGDESRGLDIIELLDQRVNRQVHVLTASVGGVERLLKDDRIDESLFRMEDLIEDLLARARGDQELELESLSLARTARDAWEGVDTAEATLTLDGDVGLTADPDRLQQLFENLFRNGVEHRSTGSRSSPDDAVAHGSPTPPSQAQEDAIDHAESVTVRVGPREQGVTHSEDGTGYGLAIVSDIVQGHGWSVAVSESESGGAQFDVDTVRSLTDVPEVT